MIEQLQRPLGRYFVTLTVGKDEMRDHHFIIWSEHASDAYVRAMRLLRQMGFDGMIMGYKFTGERHA